MEGGREFRTCEEGGDESGGHLGCRLMTVVAILFVVIVVVVVIMRPRGRQRNRQENRDIISYHGSDRPPIKVVVVASSLARVASRGWKISD